MDVSGCLFLFKLTWELNVRLAHIAHLCVCLSQWVEVGLLGLNGQSVMLSVGGVGSDERAAAPILPLWMEEPSVRAHPSREWPAPHCAQVKMTYSSALFTTFLDKVATHRNIRGCPKWAILQEIIESNKKTDPSKLQPNMTEQHFVKKLLWFHYEKSSTSGTQCYNLLS